MIVASKICADLLDDLLLLWRAENPKAGVLQKVPRASRRVLLLSTLLRCTPPVLSVHAVAPDSFGRETAADSELLSHRCADGGKIYMRVEHVLSLYAYRIRFLAHVFKIRVKSA